MTATPNDPQISNQAHQDEPTVNTAMKKVFAGHARRWPDFTYVYPVVSRRGGGLSVGVNLNIDKACNFDCIYCCVDRTVPPVRADIDLDLVREELDRMLKLAVSGQIWDDPKFSGVESQFRRINDIAFSGDGEPTAYEQFEAACRIAVELKQSYGLNDVKLIVISNATMFDRPRVRRALELLDHHQGEIWAKLDAGTEDYYQLIDRSKFPLHKVIDNILACGRARPIVIQSLFMQVHRQPLPEAEFEVYLDQIGKLVIAGCQIKLVQLYTTARSTAEQYVSPLTDEHLDRLANRFSQVLPTIPVAVYYGVK